MGESAGRFRSLGDGQVDFNGIFSKFAAYNFEGWAVLEWECALKHPEMARVKARPSSRSTSFASRKRRSMISRVVATIPSRCARWV